MISKMKESVFFSSRKQAIEMIPVAMTSAKYPGNRSAATRERTFGPVGSLFIGELLGHTQFSPQMTQIKATDKIRGFDPFLSVALFITTLAVDGRTLKLPASDAPRPDRNL